MQMFPTASPAGLPASATSFDQALERTLSGQRVDCDDVVALFSFASERREDLLCAAASLRDQGHGRRITYSAKVFVPLTRLCRDECGYCTFRRSPGEPEAETLEPDEVLALARAGARLGAKEALFSLGDRPEARFSEHRRWLAERGYKSTLDYLADVCRRVLDHTPLIPHVNPGLMDEDELVRLRSVCGSMGIMLESTSDELMLAGRAHHRAPDKAPRLRLRTIEAAGNLKIPFSTGILIGIGETIEDRARSLLALRNLHERYGHIQEVIVQNFRAKAGTRMHAVPEPPFEDLQATVAIARLVLGPRMNLQAPPNLSKDRYPELIRAGLSDWGGISPLTIDHINPEAPWPELRALRDRTAAVGYELRERLTVYPEYIRERPDFVDDGIRSRLLEWVDEQGLVIRTREAARWS